MNSTHNSCDLRSSIQHWLLGLLLCCGGAIVWALLISWVGEYLTWWFNRGHTNETFESRTVGLRENGEPYVIVNRYSRDRQDKVAEYQSVDGKLIVLDPDELDSTNKTWRGSPFSNATIYLGIASGAVSTYWIDAPEPLPWSLSLLQFMDGVQYSGTGRVWYFHWPRHPGNSGFFEGFDAKTKQRIGFIGLSGFSENKPAAADQFPAWDINKSSVAVFITRDSGQFPPGPNGLKFSKDGELPEYGVWFITPKRDRIYVINLTRRTVAATRVLSGKLLGTSEQRDATSEVVKRALLWEDRLEIVSPTLQTLGEIPFPTELHGKINSISERASGEFEVSYLSHSPKRGVIPADLHFVRFNERAEVTLRQKVTVPRSTVPQYWFAEQFLTPLSLMPLSVIHWLARYRSGYIYDENGELVRKPDEPLTWNVRLRYIQFGIRDLGWSGYFWLTLLSGLPFAALCVWKQRSLPVSRFDRVAWPLLLYVFGVVGWIAFLTHRRWPAHRVAVTEPRPSRLADA